MHTGVLIEKIYKVCTYPLSALKGHKADDLQNAVFKDSIIGSVQDVVTKSLDDRLEELSFTTGAIKLNLLLQQTPTSGSRTESDQYPRAFNLGLAGSLPMMRLHAPRPDVVTVSMKSSPTSWFASAEINGKIHHFLIGQEECY